MCLCPCNCSTSAWFFGWSGLGFNLCAVHWFVLGLILLNRFDGLLCIVFACCLGFSSHWCLCPFFGVFFGFITTYSRDFLRPVSLLKYSYFLRLFYC